jgi:hypothetical protein
MRKNMILFLKLSFAMIIPVTFVILLLWVATADKYGRTISIRTLAETFLGIIGILFAGSLLIGAYIFLTEKLLNRVPRKSRKKHE